MKRHEVLTAFGPLLVAALAALVFCGMYAYLFIFGTLLGFNVSNLDGNGPGWPFPVVYVSGVTFVIAAPIGVAWALVYMFVNRRTMAGPKGNRCSPFSAS